MFTYTDGLGMFSVTNGHRWKRIRFNTQMDLECFQLQMVKGGNRIQNFPVTNRYMECVQVGSHSTQMDSKCFIHNTCG